MLKKPAKEKLLGAFIPEMKHIKFRVHLMKNKINFKDWLLKKIDEEMRIKK